MEIRELSTSGAYEFLPHVFEDRRGKFVAPFQGKTFADVLGHPLSLAQVNVSVSRKGTIRGVHFADTPPGQAKYVWCPRGALLDVVVDLRVDSPTFGRWDAIRLDATDFHALYIAEGLGHAFVALEDETIMAYLCSTGYNPEREHGITPLDEDLSLPWPDDIEPILSDKDAQAPTLRQALDADLLPSYDVCVTHYATAQAQWATAQPAEAFSLTEHTKS
ncbi:dTDP-4-dehydrorhamnose 3,5-epimerase family protein [Phytoactinopolyspora halotolerans]|uniref:dTDP-4-keto-6-deoxy-D-glucose epimerase n=1 Tax=Phytoactinopolyspora halotolerans TaxID=1981512 RepID=A0A6L9SFS5_9ACTN|nr:dTDP-4-dehydrorhamnose 3,5-epimerase [Phytoactinopolyspora halotolerans]NEE03959.1 dTDP-4-keto-6-deoxy-D-glucose epimerase [Phytoactinopolyspora halotolerans]